MVPLLLRHTTAMEDLLRVRLNLWLVQHSPMSSTDLQEMVRRIIASSYYLCVSLSVFG